MRNHYFHLNIILLSFIIFILTISIQTQYHKEKNSTFQIPLSQQKKQSKHSCVIEHPLTIIDIDTQEVQTQSRLLQSTLHPFQIYGLFPTQSQSRIDLGLLRNIFNIATQYYKNVIKVTSLPSYLIKYPSNSGSCGITVPDQFIQSPFDQNVMDLVVFIVIQNDKSKSFVAAAAPCIKVRRPIYGYIIFNAPFVQTNIWKTGNYHSNVYVTMHELMHILALNNNFYTEFYTSPTSSTRMSRNQVINTVPGLQNRVMIITPNVKKYIQSYFSCSDTRIGGLLEDQGSSGSAYSHWQRKVFLDQMMTASSFSSGLKISPLTLYFLWDSGFYQQVDVTLSQDLYFGRNDGCPFAVGVNNTKPEFSCDTACDFYNVYAGQCSNTDSFANGAYYLRPLGSAICTLPQNSKSSSSIPGFQFNALSRCFDVVSGFSGIKPHCYRSKCVSNGIQISIQGKNYLCSPGQSVVNIPSGSLVCPQDMGRFCSVKNCQNWCNAHGICIKGKCICVSPWKGNSCQIGCPNLFDYETNECVDQCSNGKVIFNKGCINRCPPLFKPGDDKLNCIRCAPSEYCFQNKLVFISFFGILMILMMLFQ